MSVVKTCLMSTLGQKQTCAVQGIMSALGQKPTYAVQNVMSALAPIATAKGHVGFAPKSGHVGCKRECRHGHKQTSCDAAKSGLLDQLVGADEQCRRHGDPERFSRLKIDNYVKFGRPLNRKFARLRTLQNLVNKSRCSIVHIRKADAIANEASCPYKFRKAARR